MWPFSLFLIALFALSGCGDSNAPPSSPPSRPSSPPALLPGPRPDVRELPLSLSEAPTPRPIPTGPLGACLRRVENTAPGELLNALATLEHPSFAEDACRMHLAIEERSLSWCEPIALSMLRNACEVRTAIAKASPDECPRAQRELGRDAFCVALAARSPSLCGTALPAQRERCLAMVRAEENSCNRLDPELRPGCVADQRVVRPFLTLMQYPNPRPVSTVQVQIRNQPNENPDAGTWLTLQGHGRGAFLTTTGELWLVDPQRGMPGTIAFPAIDEGPFGGFVLQNPRNPGPGSVLRFRLHLRDGRVVEPATLMPTEARFTIAARVRGERVEGHFTATGRAGGIPVYLSVRFQSYVRDVVTPELLQAPNREQL